MSTLSQLHKRISESVLNVWWQALPERDRLALIWLGVFLVVVTVYISVWLPVQRQAASAQSHYQQQRELYGYLQSHASQIKSHNAVSAVEAISSDRLQGSVANSALTYHLAVERLDSSTPGQIEVALEAASFADVLQWLLYLQARGVAINFAELEKTDKNQVVSRFVFQAEISGS